MSRDTTPSPRRVALRLSLASAGLGVLAWLAWDARHDLGKLIATCDLVLFLVAAAAGVLFTLTQGVLFADLMGKQVSGGHRRSFVAAFLQSQPGKYVPGKVWSPLLQALALREHAAFGSVAVANVELAGIATIQVTALGFALLYADFPLLVACTLSVGLLLSVAIAMLPTRRMLTMAFPRLAAAVGLGSTQPRERRSTFWRALWICAAGIATNFAASYLVLYAIEATVPASARGAILGSLYLGFAVSMLAVPVPAGLGIREAAAAAVGSLVVPGIPGSIIVSAAVFFRCWQILVDVACLALGAAMVRSRVASGSDSR